MRIVISWSGNKSRKVAQELRKWLPLMFETVDVWVSSKDIGAGKRWSPELASASTEAEPPSAATASKEVARTVTTFTASEDWTVEIALPA